jgi:hypothetical protein
LEGIGDDDLEFALVVGYLSLMTLFLPNFPAEKDHFKEFVHGFFIAEL